MNDINSDYNSIMASMSAFANYVFSRNREINIKLGFISRTANNEIKNIYNTVLKAYQWSGAYGLGFIENSPTWLPYSGISEDNLHPNEIGCNFIAWSLLNYLSSYDNNARHYEQTFPTITLASGSSTDVPYFAVSCYGLLFRVALSDMMIEWESPLSVSEEFKLFNLQNQELINVFDAGFGGITIPVMVYTQEWICAPMRFRVTTDGIYVKVLASKIIPNISKLSIEGFCGYIEPINC